VQAQATRLIDTAALFAALSDGGQESQLSF
jgi:hypothetical protein